MKTKCFLTAILLTLVMSVSAQVQVFRTDGRHGAICREKKLFMMEEGDDTPIWNIVNYKKTGNKETFTLTPKEADGTYSCVMTLNDDVPTAMTLTSKMYGKQNFKLELTDDAHLNGYYRDLCGYPQKPSIEGGVPSAVPSANGGSKIGDTAKKTFGKVKGIFKKKDKDKDKKE